VVVEEEDLLVLALVVVVGALHSRSFSVYNATASPRG